MSATPSPSTAENEQVVLLDDQGRAIGTAEKATVHHARTPLHLAFSCYVFDPAGRHLVTRRAEDKATFPGIWTNTVCGHPAPGEGLLAAARRRARDELGVTVGPVRLVLPRFRYRAQRGGVVEHELCPVLVATTDADTPPAPDPTEVAETGWMPWGEFVAAVHRSDRDWSPWCREQVDQLATLGDDPAQWPAASASSLPAAARL